MSTKRFSISKGLITLGLMLVAIIGLAACTTTANNDQEVVDLALEQVAIEFASGDSLSSVTQDLTLPTSVGEVTVTWSSNNAAVVSVAGVIVRGQADVVVSLTATLTLGEVSETKVFTLTVKADLTFKTPEEALAAVTIFSSSLAYNATTGRYTTTTALLLPTRSFYQDITWSSGNTAVIANDGKVTRPAWGEDDSTVILTATIGEATREFIVTVPAVTVKPVAVSLQEAQDALLLSGISNGVAADLTLPTSVGSDGVTVTWATDNADALTAAGVVTRAPENVTVTLTATLSLSGSSVTKEFEVVVLSFAPFTEVANFVEAEALYITNKALATPEVTYAKVLGVTVVGISGDGYMIYDGASLLFVYTGGTPTNVVVGSVYDITGYVDYYYGAWQFNGTKDTERPTIVKASTAAVSVLTPTALTGSIVDYIATLPTVYTSSSNITTANPVVAFEYQYLQIDAKVRVQPADGNYGVFLVDLNYAGSGIDSTANSAFTTDALMVYYKSNLAAVSSLAEAKVTINVFLYSLRTDRNIFTVIFTGVVDDIEILPLSDQEAVTAAKAQLVATTPTEQVLATTFDLPSEAYGATISWASDNEAVINSTTGVVTPVEGTQTVVTLTATVAKGTVSETQVIVVKVGVLPTLTMADLLTATAGLKAYTEVEVMWVSGSAAVVADSTGLGYIYNSTALTFAVGDFVGLSFVVANYQGFMEITAVEVSVAKGTDPNLVLTPTVWTVAEVNAFQTSTAPWSPVYVQIDGLFGYASGTYTNAYLGGNYPNYIQTNGATSVLQNTVFTGTGFIIGKSSSKITLQGTYTNSVAVTDQDKVDFALASVKFPVASDSLIVNLTLPTAGPLGTTIAWTTSNAAVISATGQVVRPAAGAGNATATLSYTVTSGTVTSTPVEIAFTVLEVDPLVNQVYSATIDTTGSFSTAIAAGVIDTARYQVVPNEGNAVFTLTYVRNASTTYTIFNNSAGEIRLYKGTTTNPGGQLTLDISAGYVITQVVINTSLNTGASINGAVAVTDAVITVVMNGSQVTIVNTSSTGSLQITSIVISYQAVIPA